MLDPQDRPPQLTPSLLGHQPLRATVAIADPFPVRFFFANSFAYSLTVGMVSLQNTIQP